MTGRLVGRKALVTGATQGLGAAVARRFAAEGAAVAVVGRSEERGKAVAADLGAGARFVRADLADPAAAKRAAADALAGLGGLDILVNSAALPERSTLESFTVDHFDRLFRLNVLAPLLLVQATREALAARGGVVINVGSVNAYMGAPTLLVYSASKGAMMTASRNLAAALRFDRIRVHSLNIGWMDTEGERTIQAAEGRPPDFLDEAGRRSPMGRLIKPEEVAGACAWLASDEAAIFSGAVIDLDQFPVGAWGRRPPGEAARET